MFTFDLLTEETDHVDDHDGHQGRARVDVDALARRVDLECASLCRLVDAVRGRVVEAPATVEHRADGVRLFASASAQLKSPMDVAYLWQRLSEGAGRVLVSCALSDEADRLVRPAPRPPFFSDATVTDLLALLDSKTDGAASSGQMPQDTDAELARRVQALSEAEDYCLVRGAACGNLYGPTQWLRVFLCHFAPYPDDPSFSNLFDEAEAVRAALHEADLRALDAVPDPNLPRAVLDAFRSAGTGRMFSQTRAALERLVARRREGTPSAPRPVPAFLQTVRAQLVRLSHRARERVDATRPAPCAVGDGSKHRVNVLLTTLRMHNTV